MHKKVYGITGYGQGDHWCEQGANWYFNKWHCVDETGLDTTIRIDRHTKNIECPSNNGKDCLRGNDDVCKTGAVNVLHRQLVCGPDHIVQYPSTNPYLTTDDHWCKRGNAYFFATGDWICGKDLGLSDIPFRLNFNGDIECGSNNGRDCFWGGNCNSNIASITKPLACGRAHQNNYNMPGYNSKEHWCYSLANWFFTPNRRWQ